MDKRFHQANKEALVSLLLTISYLLLWIMCSYFLGSRIGLFGLPAWFEASCLFMPIGFILLCYLVMKKTFKNINLN